MSRHALEGRAYRWVGGRATRRATDRESFAHFLAPAVADSIEVFVIAPAAVGELGFAWLLVKGVRVPEPKVLVPVAA